ncbi:MAG: DUF805 domain-containing protein [Acetobacteraceae bacterium]
MPRTFTNSIRICFRKYAVFNGRAPRSELWYFFLFGSLILTAVLIIGAILDAGSGSGLKVGGPASALTWIVLFLPSLSVQVRRLHDLDRTGWWYVIGFVRLAGGLLILNWNCLRGTPGPNRFGPPVGCGA